jgi:hypothetical protein
MKHKAIGVALVAAMLQVQPTHAATALEYAVHAQLPHGESVSGTLHLGDRSSGPLIDVLNASNAVAEAGAAGKNTAQVTLGPDHTCINLAVSTRGNTVTATGTANLPPPPPPPPPPQDDNDGNRPQQLPPPANGPDRGANESVRIIVTLDHQHLARAHGDVSPANGGHGPHVEWTLEKVGQ